MRKQNMSSPSPVTDGTNVWAMTGTGILKAFDYEGKELWSRDIQKIRPIRTVLGIRILSSAPRGLLYIQVLHGMKRHPRMFCGSTKPQEERSGASSARRERSMNPRTPILRPLSSATARATELVVSRGRRRYRTRPRNREGTLASGRTEPDQATLRIG